MDEPPNNPGIEGRPRAIATEYQLTAASGLGSFPASLAAVLDEIEARGGVEAYLASAGVTDSQLEVLRARAIGL